MNHFLKNILDNKMLEVQQLKKNMSPHTKAKKIYDGKFKNALLKKPTGRVIAEIKRCSPSKGKLAEIPDAAQLATQYLQGGAVAISVLTDQKFFSGSLDDLTTVSRIMHTTPCAVLRKDFIIDTVQLIESAEHGADAVLLIAGVLKDQLSHFIETAYTLGLDTLVEVHDEDECKLAIASGAQIIGVNHRNLNSFEMENDRALSLLNRIPKNIISVAESGIHTAQHGAALCLSGFNAVLIGEALVTSTQPESFIHQVRQLCAHK
jgi:indole-3-glycerol phosphate synthase